MYIVHNLTNRTIVLSDLKIEIGPRKTINLEMAATLNAIENSRDLKRALEDNKIALTKYTTIESNKEYKNQNNEIKDEKINKLIRTAISEELGKNSGIEDTIKKAIVSNMGDLIKSIREEINAVKIETPKISNISINSSVSPEKLAEMSQKSIGKISGEIETGGQKKTKEIRIINKKNSSDLADELG